MRNREHRAGRKLFSDGALDQRVGLRIDIRGRFIQHQYTIVSQNGSR